MDTIKILQALEQLKADTSRVNSFSNAKTVYARIVGLENQLGLKTSGFSLNVRKSVERIIDLEAQLTAKGGTAAATAIANSFVPAPAPLAEAGKSATELVSGIDATQLTATVADYLSLSADNRKQFCMDRGVLPHTEFSALNPAQKATYLRDGGQVHLEPKRRAMVSAKMPEQQLADRRFVFVGK